MVNKTKVRALNYRGIERFAEFITQTRKAEAEDGKQLAVPSHLMTDPEFLELQEFNSEVDLSRRFKDRYELGEYLVSQLGRSFIDANYEVHGVWSWFALGWASPEKVET